MCLLLRCHRTGQKLELLTVAFRLSRCSSTLLCSRGLAVTGRAPMHCCKESLSCVLAKPMSWGNAIMSPAVLLHIVGTQSCSTSVSRVRRMALCRLTGCRWRQSMWGDPSIAPKDQALGALQGTPSWRSHPVALWLPPDTPPTKVLPHFSLMHVQIFACFHPCQLICARRWQTPGRKFAAVDPAIQL